MSKSEEKKLKRIKQMTIFPVIMLVVLTVCINGLILLGVKNISDEYIYNSKLREGRVLAEKYCESIRTGNILSVEELNENFLSMQKFDKEFIGLRIERDDTVIYSAGKSFPDSFNTYITEDSTVLLETTGNNTLYRIILNDFNLSFSMNLLEATNTPIFSDYSSESPAIAYQTVWYEETYKDTTVYCGRNIPITAADVQLLAITGIELHGLGVIIAFVVLTIIIRVIHSQKSILNAYYTDKETGGHNWYHFTAHVGLKTEKKFILSDWHKKKAIIQVRIEKLPYYISCYGEKAGNHLIYDTHKVLRENLPKKAILARYDLSDFAIYLTYEYEHELSEMFEAIIKKLEDLRDDTSLVFKAGICTINPDEDFDISDVYSCASIARQQAENTFECNVLFFSSSMRNDIYWERKMENDLAAGIQNNEFQVYLQPKYSCDNETIASAEALVRWQHPTEGLLSPYKFIDIFERTGQIVKLDDYMISNVAKIQSEFIKEGKPAIPISVNLSRIHFAKTDLAEHICRLVDEYEVPHNLIEIELTESAFFDDKERIISTADKLREYGFEVSLDDFGSGYSSLNSLRNIPVDIVKLDSGFFRGKDEDGKGSTIVKEVISLAKELNKKVVAEGIEEREQVDFLKNTGCDYIQGYYYAKPMPIEEFINNYH